MLYVDVSDFLEYARFNSTLTGIQRVSAVLINRLTKRLGVDGFRLIAYHPNKRTVQTYSPEHFAGDYVYDQLRYCAYFDLLLEYGDTVHAVSLRAYVRKRYGKGLPSHLHTLRLLIANAVSGGQAFQRRNIVRNPGASAAEEPKLVPGDTVFVPGAIWNMPAFRDHLTALSERGVEIIQLLHDLIPLVTPEHVFESVPRQFAEWLDSMARIVSVFVVSSRATEADLRVFLDRNGHTKAAIRVVTLAHEFLRAPAADEAPFAPVAVFRPELAGRIRQWALNESRLPYVLVVGTIESRKNIWTLALVWKSLYDELGHRLPRLIFAGKRGGMKDDFDAFMRATGGLYGYIRILERPNDDELAYLYEHCLFSVFVSYYEGWGLPVGECLWFGRPVIASSASSTPEVGGTLADYADPYDFVSIRQAVRRMIVDDEYREQRASRIDRANLRTWADFADELWSVLQAHAGPVQSRSAEPAEPISSGNGLGWSGAALPRPTPGAGDRAESPALN
ncbi:MAG: glycosyltransferase [Rhodoplanes sp.]|uniref:glycosyltransferase n=1 Tax=Rhodoplanes sp. TaxID=1968906 RepID=UPI001845F685|nr:glycosyltransferase [Rhodoplanes sp.]NVO13536.1 glycosyltransferase [Rhodoplanes sp.]